MWFGAANSNSSSNPSLRQDQSNSAMTNHQEKPSEPLVILTSPNATTTQQASCNNNNNNNSATTSNQIQYKLTSDNSGTPKSTATTSPPPINVSSTMSHHSSASASSRPEKISFYFKTSIFTHRVTIETDKMDLGSIKELAIAFLDQLYFQHQLPPNCYMGEYIRKHFLAANTNQADGRKGSSHSLYERLVLRKYLADQESFVPFNSVSDIEPDSYISIELSERQPQQSHNSNSNTSGNINTNISASTTSTNRVKIAHEFKPESFYFITLCYSCNTVIKGVYRQGFKCQFCYKNFCPKCKVKAEAAGDSCLSSAPQTNHNSSNNPPPSPQPNSGQTDTGHQSSDESNHPPGDQTAATSKLDMSKRKSTSNLLHFNLANPFKSHHSPQTGNQTPQQQPATPAASSKPSDESKTKFRNSAGALDPILQQLSKNRESQQAPSPTTTSNSSGASKETTAGSSLQVAQLAHLSSSHQNLYSNSKVSEAGEGTKELVSSTNSGTLSQSPSGSRKNHPINQLSNSARASAHDLHANSPASAVSRSRDNQVVNHAFISMDWIQISGEPLCGVCNKVVKNQQQQQQQQQQPAPSMCKNCKLQVHAQCQSLVLTDCLSRIAANSRAAADGDKEAAESPKDALKNTNSNVSRDNIRLHRLAPSVKHVKRPDLTKPIIEGWLKHTTLADEQARQHYWRLDETDITLYENDTSTRYFKAIALNKITRVMSAHSLPKRVREDVLTNGQLTSAPGGCSGKARSANTSPAKSPELQAQMKAMFAFELTTGSMYLVQAGDECEASRWRESLASITSQKKKQLEEDKPSAIAATGQQPSDQPLQTNNTAAGQAPQQAVTKLVESVNNLYLNKTAEPATSANNNNNTATAPDKVLPAPAPPAHQRHHQHHHYPPSRQHQRTGGFADHQNRSRLYNRPRKTIKLDPMRVPDHWIEGKYLIEPDRSTGRGFEELGSGQFGKVYAAISEWKAEDAARGYWSGVPVAIKEISKTRFDLRQQAKLKNEANILSRLDHPGVIILERVHDLPDKIYIVMEQLEDDMLEMIVSTEEKRLNERVTKFLTYQILEALRYLHAQNIAHCDLKPENVLLVERRSQFPQIKLCDFGFAKIIEDNSFRSSLVGTPAYLAPEVVKGERYNRSVDLWSVGVIVYVSLSGEFPFNEGENIHEQISRANFANYMYPEQPWGKISQKAKNFINSLLNVNCEKRKSARQAQMHEWIQDFQCWCDLSELELRVGKRWVTDDADYDHWSRYAREHNLQIPRSAIQLHDELNAD